MPKVSVIIPTYNRARLLRTAIESARNQTFKDFEIIVSDDKSTDHTREVVESFNGPRIKYVRNEGRKGPSATRNTAILVSEGDYIAFLDDDDEWLPDKLQMQVELLDSSLSNICGVYSNRLIIDRKADKVLSDDPEPEKYKGNLLFQLMIKSPIHTSTVIIRKSCLDEIGLFDETISYMEDRDMWIRLSMKWDFEYISKPLTKAYIHGFAHLSHNLEGQTAGREKLLERYHDLFKKNRKSLGAQYLCLGAQYCQLRQMKKGRNNILKGIIKYPFNKIAYLHLFSSFFGPSNYQRLRNCYKSTQLE
jgi:glycosyltransferase involved in cell wall biosynthesis